MPSKKKNKGGGGSGGLFSCFGGGTDDQPEIRYEPENGAPQIMESDYPMPDIKELDEKFAAVVVSYFLDFCVKTFNVVNE